MKRKENRYRKPEDDERRELLEFMRQLGEDEILPRLEGEIAAEEWLLDHPPEPLVVFAPGMFTTQRR